MTSTQTEDYQMAKRRFGAAAQIMTPTPERERHDEIEVTQAEIIAGKPEIVFRVKAVTQIDKYWERGLLASQTLPPAQKRDQNDILRAVGNEYGALIFKAHRLGQPSRQKLDRLAAIPLDEDDSFSAAEKLRRTERRLGEEHASVLFSVCGEDFTATAWAIGRARQRGWATPNGRYGMAMLRDALVIVKNIWG